MKLKISDDLELDFDIENYDKIAVRVSGGADSAILLVMLADCIMKMGAQKTKYLQPLMISFEGKMGIVWSSRDVIDFVKEMFPEVNIRPQLVYPLPEGEEYLNYLWHSVEPKLFEDGVIDSVFNGANMNPTYQEAIEFDASWGDIWHLRRSDRDPDNLYKLYARDMRSKLVPMWKLNKKRISQIYTHYGLVDTLFPLSFSCEGRRIENGFYSYHCGKCWWCKERMWGFGRLV